MSSVKTILKAGLWLALGGVYKLFNIQKEVKFMQKKTTKLYKMGVAFKTWVKKSCEIKSGSHEMAKMMWMIINFNNGF